MFSKVLRVTATVIATILVAYTAFLVVVFLAMGFGANGRIEIAGWLMLAGFLTTTVLGSFCLWRHFKRDSRSGGLPNYIAACVAFGIAIALFTSEADFLTITIPMLLLGSCLVILSRRGDVRRSDEPGPDDLPAV